MTRAAATARYLLADALRGQRVLIPVVAFVLVVGIVVINDHATATGPWLGTTLALYPAAAWVALALAGTEEPAARAVTTASAGGPGVVTVGLAFAALAVDATLVAVAVAVPALASGSADVLPGVLAHVAAATTGTAVGLALGAPVIRRVGWSAAAVVVVVVVTATAPGLPPVGVAARALTSGGSGLPLDAALGLVLLALGAAVNGLAAARA